MKKEDFTHIIVRDARGNDFLCPASEKFKRSERSEVDLNECVISDVPGRYAARVKVRDS